MGDTLCCNWREVLAIAGSLCLSVLVLLPAPLLAAGEDRSVAAACWSAEALHARPGEGAPLKGDRRFDRPEPDRTLAPFAPVPPELRGSVRRVELPPGRKLVALTFDLCEQPGEVAGYDGAIVDYLRANGIKATFFAGGKWLRSHEERGRQLLSDPLFEIGSHGWAHRNLRLLTGTARLREVLWPQQAYEGLRADVAAMQCARSTPAALGHVAPRIRLFRFPYGACNPEAMAAVNEAGLIAVQWDVSSGDPSPMQSARAIADQLVRHAKPGSILINHANGRGHHTAAALPLAIPKLKAMGFEFVTVSELLAAGRPVVTATCYDSRPGDTERYDHPLGLSRSRAPSERPVPTETAKSWAPWVH